MENSFTPDSFEALYQTGLVHFRANRLDEAIACWQRAVSINPEAKDAHQLIQSALSIQASTDNVNLSLERVQELLGEDMPGYRPSMDIKPMQWVRDFGDDESLDELDLSIIIPIKEEEENLPILYDKLTSVLSVLDETYEIIFIDDGSRDNSLAVMREMAAKDVAVKVIQFRRNYGQTAALSAGFKLARGRVIITLDGDLQNDPDDIPRLLEKMAEGFDLVNGWRRHRQDKAISRLLPSYIANRLINKLIEGSGIQLHDFGCTLKAYKKGIVKNIKLYGEMHRFIPVFAAWMGVRVAELEVKHHPRIHGEAKYNLSRVTRVIFDLLVVRFFSDFMTRPIQFFGRIAKASFSVTVCVILMLSVLKFTTALPFSWDALLVLMGIMTMGCGQIVIMGLLGEIMMRIYFEGQHKDYFVVEKVHAQPGNS